MARVKFPHDEEHFVPWVGRTVKPGETVEVPDADLENYLEAGWSAAQDKETKKAVAQLDKAAPASGEERA